MFDDGSFSNDTYPEDIVVRMCLIWDRLDRSPPCDVVLQQKLHHTIFFHSWVNKIKDILSILESRLCQLGSSWSWGTCPSEMARWTVLWCQIPRIQYFLHVPGMTLFCHLTKLLLLSKAGQRCTCLSPSEWSGSQNFMQNDWGCEKSKRALEAEVEEGDESQGGNGWRKKKIAT